MQIENHRAGRLKAFDGYDGAKRAARTAAWIRATIFDDEGGKSYCRRNRIPFAKAQGEGNNTSGAVLVPDEIETSILSLRDLAGVFRRQATTLKMGSDTRSWPRRTGGLTANFTAEGGIVAESAATWDNLNLTAKKIATLTRLSSELHEDEDVDLAEWFVSEIAYAFAATEDRCGFIGDGTSTYGGITGVLTKLLDGTHGAGKITAASGHGTFALLDATDLSGLMAALPEYVLPSASWIVSAYGYATCFARLGAVAGNDTGSFDGRPALNYLGFPVVTTPNLPGSGSQTGKVMVAFGDLSLAAAIGSRRGVTVRASQHRYLENDQIGILGTERFDINVHDLGDNAKAGPIVGLIGG